MSNHIPAAPDALAISLQQEIDELTQLGEKQRAATNELRAELVDTLNRSASEIRDRDAAIERLGQKANAYDVLVLAIHGLTAGQRQSQVFGEDVAYAFQRRARQLMEEDARQ